MGGLRLTGLALLAGAGLRLGALLPLTFLLSGGGRDPYAALDPLYVPVNLVAAVGSVLVLWGLPQVYADGARGLGRTGGLGVFLLVVVEVMFGVFLSLLSALVNPWVAAQAPALLAGPGPAAFLPFFVGGTVLEVLGCGLLALALGRFSSASRGPGLLLALAAVTAVVGFIAEESGSLRGIGAVLAGNLSFFPLLVALGWLGWLMATRRVAGR
jgi:hypothetical protein